MTRPSVKNSALVAAAVMLGGCATAYKPEGHGGGFTDSRFGPNLFAVAVRANGFTSVERAAEIATLRSAELTLKHGFTHFIIIERNQEVSTSTVTMPATTYTTGNVSVVGNTAYLNSRATTTGGETLSVSKPRVHYKIECYQGQPDRKLGLSYDARLVCESLADKFGASCQTEGPGKGFASSQPPINSNGSGAAPSRPLPSGWQQSALSDSMVKKGVSAYIINKTIDAGALVVAVPRTDILDMALHAKSLRAKQISQMDQGKWSEIAEVSVKGRKAWRFWVSGTLKQGMAMKYLGTLIEGESKAVFVTAWTVTDNYDDSRESMELASESFADL